MFPLRLFVLDRAVLSVLIVLPIQPGGGSTNQLEHLVWIVPDFHGRIGLADEQTTDGEVELLMSKQLIRDALVVGIPGFHNVGLDP